MPYDLGEEWVAELTVRDPDGVLTDADVAAKVTSPSDVVTTPAPVRLSLGTYRVVAAPTLDEPLWWDLLWQVTGAVVGTETQRAYVRPVALVATRTSTTLTVAEVQEHLEDEADPDLLDRLLRAAEGLVAEYVGSPLQPTEVVEAHTLGTPIVLAQSRVLGPVEVLDADSQLVTGYEVNPAGILTRPFGYLSTGARVTVRYTAGFDPLPDPVRLAVLYTVQHAYEAQRGAVVGDAGADESFVVSRGFALPNRAKEYLAPYARGPVVA